MDNPALAWNSVFLGQLLVVAWIDHRQMIIPNWLNVSIAFTGLLFGLLTGQQNLLPMTVAGISAFLVMWMVRVLYYVLTKRSGLGMGDVKFVAALAIWVGFSNLPLVILVASVSALSLLTVKQAIWDYHSTRCSFGIWPSPWPLEPQAFGHS